MSSIGRPIRHLTLALALGAGAIQAQTAPLPRPGRIFAPTAVPRGNRVHCPIYVTWDVCRAVLGAPGGGTWPRGSANGYVFNSGLQFAGIIGGDGGPWAGDTSGAFFYDLKGTTEHGEGLEGVFLSGLARDRAEWPRWAMVPAGFEGRFYRPSAQGLPNASVEDGWWLTWDGDSRRRSGRAHPLGVVVETRLLQFSYPVGAEDIMYFVTTYYNITSLDPAGYAGVRPELRQRLLQYATAFHAGVTAEFGVVLPTAGYTITNFHGSHTADFDVGFVGSNYAAVHLPFSLAFTYDHSFGRVPGWSFPADIFSRPFMAGAGLVGVKALVGPTGGRGIQGFYPGLNSGRLGAPRDVKSLYRYLAGTLSLATGDPNCPLGPVAVTHLCLVESSPSDTKQLLSLPPVNLVPGGSATAAWAYLYAAPVGPLAGCPGAGCSVPPGDPRLSSDVPFLLSSGANPIDSIAGFNGFTDLNADGVAAEEEFRVVPRSLMGKARVAQALFDARFQIPEAPDSPEFYLVPGSGRVTVLWRPSTSETAGDPYFGVASSAVIPGPGGVPVSNPLFDPNYRQFDVEGYRIYRGRTDRPDELSLLAQFDYSGTTIRDYAGRVNPTALCAPEVGIRGDCVVDFDSLAPGVTPTTFQDVPLVGAVIQVRDGDRIPLTDGSTLVLHADTIGDFESGRCLCDTRVPFSWVDSTVRNSFRYFYTVTAFDVNSLQSGPSSLESARIIKGVSPRGDPVDRVSQSSLRVRLEGRGVELDSGAPLPSLDSLTARFSGPFPPSNAWSLTLRNLVQEVVQGVQEARLRLDSIQLGQSDLSTCCAGGRPGIPAQYYFTLTANGASSTISLPLQQGWQLFSGVASASSVEELFRTDSVLAASYGGRPGVVLGDFEVRLPAASVLGDWGLGMALFSLPSPLPGRHARYNGARWFDGPSPVRGEVASNPIGGACGFGTSACSSTLSFNNAGQLTGVTTVYQPLSYTMLDREWRNLAESQSGARRAADYNLYWGTAGRVDSVVDVTHNVPVPFSTGAGGTWGILNTSAQGPGGHDGRLDVLTPTDWSCVEPFRSRLTQPANQFYPCTSAGPFLLSPQAELGQVAFAAGPANTLTNPQAPGNPANLSAHPGFALYLAGTITHFGLSALPARGTVWSLRDYSGVIYGGNGIGGAGDLGPAVFVPAERPLTAVGVELVATLEVTNGYAANVRRGDLRRVHTVPDPYYLGSEFDEGEVVRFVNLPQRAIIRIYSMSGVLVALLEHNDPTPSGEQMWNLRSRSGRRVASGVYFFHVESDEGRRVGRFTLVNFGQ